MNKLIKLLLIVCLVLIAIILAKNLFTEKIIWEFVGYQYRWNENYVANSSLATQQECVSYGNEWLKGQNSSDALFTCSTGCRDAGFGNSMEVCNLICEYEKTGLVKCRK